MRKETSAGFPSLQVCQHQPGCEQAVVGTRDGSLSGGGQEVKGLLLPSL